MNKLPDRIRIKDIARLADVSVGTVDRVIHGRSGVSESSKKRVEEILKQLDYQPNMYASALASNKRYTFICLLPQHHKGEYWTAVEVGINEAIATYSDLNISVKTYYYDPYNYQSFADTGREILELHPDGVMVAPTIAEYTRELTNQLHEKGTPFIYIDSNIKEISPLAFFGQNSRRSGYFAARMLMLLAQEEKEVVIFRKMHKGIIGSNQQENREKGFRQYMEEHHPACLIRELNLPAEHSHNERSMLDAFFLEHNTVRNGITFNSKAYIIGEYLTATARKGFNLIGYDLLERNVACLRNGSISFLLAQQPELQGFNGIKTLCDHLIFKKEVARINYMPIDLLTVETIDYYSNK